MSTITTIITQTIDLDRGVGRPQPLIQRLVYGNDQAHTFRLLCTRQGIAAPLVNTACMGYVKRKDGVTVPLEGVVKGNEACVTLTAACYAVPGSVTISMELITGSVRATHALWLAQVECPTTDAIGGDAALSISDALQRIEAVACPDWSQNDPSMPDYIRNRTHYIAHTTIDCTGNLGLFDGWRKVSDAVFTKWMMSLDETTLLIDSNGVQSTVSPIWSIATNDNTLCSYGRVNIIQTVIMVVHEEGYALGPGVYVDTNSNPAVLALTYGEAVPLDEMYIPDSIARTALLPPMDTTLTEEGYTADAKAVGDRLAELAPPIIPTATGDVIALPDSAERKLRGLSLYGKTTQNGTPGLSARVPLENAGSTGSISVQVMGKNLFDLSSVIANTGVTIERSGDALRVHTTAAAAWKGCRSQQLRLHAGVTYTLSAHVDSLTSGTPSIGFRDAATQQFLKRVSASSGQITVTYTPEQDIDAYAAALVTDGTASNGDAVFSRIQLELSSSATAYEPYKDGGAMAISTPNGLPGLPVSEGGSYIDASGQQWLCDEIDLARGVYIQRVGTLNSAAMTTWNASSLVNPNGHVYIRSFAAAKPGSALWTNRTRASVPAQMTKDQFVLQQNSSGVTVLYVVSDAATAAEAAAAITAENSTLMYALAEPVETPLSLPDMTLESQFPVTTVQNDGAAGMAVDYMADTKNYIDLKLAAIASAVLSL